nr:hypothetical protein [Cochlodiniinecator piscidefendens]
MEIDINTLHGIPILAILRGVRVAEVLPIAECLISASIRRIEVPLNSPDAFMSIGHLMPMRLLVLERFLHQLMFFGFMKLAVGLLYHLTLIPRLFLRQNQLECRPVRGCLPLPKHLGRSMLVRIF